MEADKGKSHVFSQTAYSRLMTGWLRSGTEEIGAVIAAATTLMANNDFMPPPRTQALN
jgi:hypothetical protein